MWYINLISSLCLTAGVILFVLFMRQIVFRYVPPHQPPRPPKMPKMPARIYQSDLKLVSLDEVLTWKFRCPECGNWGYIDDDQLHGRVSIQCGIINCSFHETHDLTELLDQVQ